MRYNVEIDAVNVDKFKEWFEQRGGVLVWTNQEIGGGAAQEIFTPATAADGQPYPKPNWRYDNAELVDRDSIRVVFFEVLETLPIKVAHNPPMRKAQQRAAKYKEENIQCYCNWKDWTVEIGRETKKLFNEVIECLA